MAMPPMPSGRSGPGHGPFGARAFNGALIGCAFLVVIGAWMVVAGSGSVFSLGASFVVMGLLGLAVGGLGLLVERRVQRRSAPPNPRRRPAPSDLHRRNGRRPYPPDGSRIRKDFDDRP